MRTLQEVALDIQDSWKSMEFNVAPFVELMLDEEKATEFYGDDAEQYLIKAFLHEAMYWRTRDAYRIKEELKTMIKDEIR